MRECVDEGMLQSYFDGELPRDLASGIASHMASCLTCTQAAREVERETLLLSEALEAEFSGSVPTERLKHKVDAAIAGLSLVTADAVPAAAKAGRTPAVPVVRGWLESIAEFFRISPQRGFAYAGLVAVLLFAAVFGLVRLGNHSAKPDIANNNSSAPAPTVSSETLKPTVALNKAPDIEPPKDRTTVGQPSRRTHEPRTLARDEKVKLLPGEGSYLRQIARLDSTIKAEDDKPMRPAMQAEYQRNLAVIERAIAATRSAAKSKPNDPDAAEFMFAAYQSKVDLLNQVADSRLSNRPKP